MEAQDPRSAVSAIVGILRKATRIVQLAPFVYLVFYSIYLFTEHCLPEELLCVADGIMSATPLSIDGMLVFSKIFKLCAWHKAACCIPFLSQVEGYIDSYVVTFTQTEIAIINTTLGLLVLAFLLLAIKHFIYGEIHVQGANRAHA